MVSRQPEVLAFVSYSHDDDKDLGAEITKFRQELERWVRLYLGDEPENPIEIFQDRSSIQWGESWRDRIRSSLSEVVFFVPIVTPRFFTSRECREEMTLFLERERELGRNDLVLPVYFIDAVQFEDESDAEADEVVAALRAHQYVDWRELKHKRVTTLRRNFEALAQQMTNALRRQVESGAASEDQPTAMVAPTEPSDDAQPDDGGVVAVGSGELGPGEMERFEIVLLEDVAYDIYVSPYDSTVDFDLGVFGADGELLVSDVDVTADARCRITPESTGQYILVVTCVRGASGYDIAVTRAEPDVLAAGTIHQGEVLSFDVVLETSRRYRIAVVADDPFVRPRSDGVRREREQGCRGRQRRQQRLLRDRSQLDRPLQPGRDVSPRGQRLRDCGHLGPGRVR